jgi:phosphoribosylformimino-5-aminoimidazole carboxamide ribotide isomerase
MPVIEKEEIPIPMDLILAMDLRQNLVVHGKSGHRETYKPLDWGCSPTAEPAGFVRAIRPKSIYIADLDRIEGTGSHDAIVKECAGLVSACYVDRGCRSPDDLLRGEHITNIIGTETGGSRLSEYHGGYLSLDIKDGMVIPSKSSPETMLRQAASWDFEGCIILNIAAVGTRDGLDPGFLENLRSAYPGRLLYGGGVATVTDLELLRAAGFDGAIIATALHYGAVPVDWIRRGTVC